MSGGISPDPLLYRRIAALERQVAYLETAIRRLSVSRSVTPLSARLWRATLNEAFGDTTSHYASADLVTLGGDDTLLDVQLYDPIDAFTDLATASALYVAEQIDADGKRHFIPLQSPCPP